MNEPGGPPPMNEPGPGGPLNEPGGPPPMNEPGPGGPLNEPGGPPPMNEPGGPPPMNEPGPGGPLNEPGGPPMNEPGGLKDPDIGGPPIILKEPGREGAEFDRGSVAAGGKPIPERFGLEPALGSIGTDILQMARTGALGRSAPQAPTARLLRAPSYGDGGRK
jgi:hypothetical protein